MVTLYLTALDGDANERTFSCVVPTLESVCDFLNDVVTQGDTLLSAVVVEGSVRTSLPLTAFDGVPTAMGMSALVDQWTSVLDQPRWGSLPHQQALIELTRRQLRCQQAKQVRLRAMIDQYSQWEQWVRHSVRWSARQRRVTDRYGIQLAQYQTQLTDTRRSIVTLTNRLTQLTA